MSIKKELLGTLTEDQLHKLAETKGIAFTLSPVQKQYYEQWSVKDRLVDMMATYRSLKVSDIEAFIQNSR